MADAASKAFVHNGQGEIRLYLFYMGLAGLIIGSAFLFQIYYVYDIFEPKMVIAPLFVCLFMGIFLGRNAVLKRRLERSSEQFRAVADLAEEFIFYQRIDGSFDYVSPACRIVTGYRSKELQDDPALLERMIHPQDRMRWEEHKRALRESCMPQSIDLRLLHRNGSVVWISHTAVPVYDIPHQRVIGLRATSLDITQRKQYEARIEHQASYDPLTALPNRRLLSQRINELIESGKREQNGFALLFLDLDRFKYLNDSLGHSFGDQMLKMLSRRLSEALAGERMISRFGGDEFVILLPNIGEIWQAEAEAQRLLELVEQPLRVNGMEYFLTGSIGIALYPGDGEDGDTLISNADAAMYRSKGSVHSKIQRYQPSIVTDAAAFVALEGRVRKGLRSGEFFPYYQPKVSLLDNTIIGYEALARWRRADGTIGGPEQFISIAEETGMIRELGKQMLAAVCRQVHSWQAENRHLPVAVNVSERQFIAPDFVVMLEQLLQEHAIEPSMLQLEITEDALIGDMAAAVERLEAIRALGIRIALDDFGTGYSSLNYLCQLPIDQVKIDRSFIIAARRGSKELKILRNIVSLCNELRLEIVAEGIETVDQLEMLRSLGCRIGQGYYFQKPMPAHEVAILH